ncbi:MAG: polysaccharide deacetylase family protein [Bacillota bacterium]|nr:polysaccharide deacetylase family protein [Bacillota bacterium]
MRYRGLKFRFSVLLLVFLIIFFTQSFAFTISDIPDNTIKLGDDFFDLNSNAMNDPAGTIPIQSLLTPGINQNRAYFKIGGNWYDLFNLNGDQTLTPENAMTADQVNAIQGFGKWYKAGDEVVVLSDRAIKEIPVLKEIASDKGTEYASINLPKQVKVVLDDNSTIDVGVTWDAGTPLYNKDVPGRYQFSGTLASVEGVTNPNNLKPSIEVEVVIPNSDPNPNTTMNTSSGTTLFEFDNQSDWVSSTSANIEIDQANFVSGTASSALSPSTPIAILDATGTATKQSFFQVQTSGNIGDKLKDMQNIEFNIYVPDKTKFDYMVIKFYTNDFHSCFYQNGIGNWEVSNGWNKIRRSVGDFEYVDSSGTAGVSQMSAMSSMNSLVQTSDGIPAVNDLKTSMQKSISLLNNTIYKQKAGKKSALLSSAAASGSSFWGNIYSMDVDIAFTNPNLPTVNFDKIAINVAGNAKLLFTFDDSWYDVKQYAEPILTANNFKATLWTYKDGVLNESGTGPLNIMSVSDINSLYAKGWDVGNHTVDHPDDITALSPENVISEYRDNQTWLDQNGWTRASQHVCYPSGSYNEQVINLLKSIGVKSARTTEYGIQPTPVFNMYRLKIVFISRDTLVSDIEKQVDEAVATGSTIIFMLHRVEDSPIMTNDTEGYNALAVSTANFQAIVNYVKQLSDAGSISVETISQWYNEYIGN